MKIKRNYTVYFELFGKKMKTEVLAESDTDAKERIKDKIVFHKTCLNKEDAFNKISDMAEDLFKML